MTGRRSWMRNVMFKRFFNFLYGNVPARFVSDFPIAASIDRLRGGMSAGVFSSIFREVAMGRVTESRVYLQRVKPFVRNGFKPVFVGTFMPSQGGVALEGRFTMSLFTRIFMTVWLSFVVLWTAVAAATALNPGRLPED